MAARAYRTCLECGDPITGRSDKKFCSDYCRTNYNNRRLEASHSYIRRVNSILLKNKRVLDYMKASQSKSIPLSLAREMGFCQEFHTSESRQGRKRIYHVYERKFLIQNNYLFLTE